MKSNLNRRSFLKRAALTTGALTAAHYFPGPNLLAETGTIDKLNCVQIGCGGRGMSSHIAEVIGKHGQNLYAIVDPDERKHGSVKKWAENKGLDAARIQVFTDYREMFDKIGKQIDAVFIATPNHHHARPAMLAMNLGKAVYCEKPLTHDIAEARKLRQMAAQSKMPAQMGNQGHCEEGYHRLCEFIAADVVGKITETHSWTDRANGGAGPRPPSQPAPAGMHWEEWIGPAPYRDFH